MVEMVWSGKIDIHIGNGMKVMGRDRYLHGKDSFSHIVLLLFTFFISLFLFLLICFPSFFLSSSFLHFRFFFSFSSSCIL